MFGDTKDYERSLVCSITLILQAAEAVPVLTRTEIAFDTCQGASDLFYLEESALLLMLLPLFAVAISQTFPLCGYNHLDEHGYSWTYNLTNLALEKGDYGAVAVGGQRVVLNVCKRPLSICRPVGREQPRGTPTAIVFSGPVPPSTSKCSGGACTQQCTMLGWGSLGGAHTQWSLIDPHGPFEGVRLTHVGYLAIDPAHFANAANGTAGLLPMASPPPPPVPSSFIAVPSPPPIGTPTAAAPPAAVPPATISARRPPAFDEYGEPRPPLLTVDFVCEPRITGPAILEVITIAGESTADTALRIRSVHACPTHRLCATAATGAAAAAAQRSPADGAPASVDDDMAAYDNPADVDSGVGLSWWQVLLATLLAVGLLGVLFVNFAALKLRGAFAPPLAAMGVASVTDTDWAAAVLGDDDEHEPGFGRSYRAI